MSFLDKLVAAIAPPESDEDRREAHFQARAMAHGNGWLTRALDHHEQIESGFAKALGAGTKVEAEQAAKDLAALIIAHSIAEEVVLYPALVIEGHSAHAGEAYQEQQMAKIQFAELERLDPLSQDWRDKLEHIRGAVLHHIYREEGTWFPELVREAKDHEMLDRRFAEEFNRCQAS